MHARNLVGHRDNGDVPAVIGLRAGRAKPLTAAVLASPVLVQPGHRERITGADKLLRAY
jgi:hypothetical protein